MRPRDFRRVCGFVMFVAFVFVDTRMFATARSCVCMHVSVSTRVHTCDITFVQRYI